MKLLAELNQSGLTIVMVTHDMSLAQQAHSTVSLVEGVVEKT